MTLFVGLPESSVFHVWWATTTAPEGGRVDWWQKEMADKLPNYTNADRVVSFDQFTASSLHEDVLGSG